MTLLKKNQSGSVLVYVIVILAIASAAFQYNHTRSAKLVKSINKTINAYKVDAKLLEIRSLLTNVDICEGSLKGLNLNASVDFTLKNTSGVIDINLSDDEIRLDSLKLLPDVASAGEIASGKILVTFKYKTGTENFEKDYPLYYNFIVNGTTKVIKECLGEKTEESSELYKITVAKKREDICKDALHGSIQNGKCVWAW